MIVKHEDFKKITVPNYLGNKLRVLDHIIPILIEETEEDGWVCDLFSGSGSVTAALSDYRPVIAVDIQNYSNEFINGFSSPIQTLDVHKFMNTIDSEFERLSTVFTELLKYEEILLHNSNHLFELANFIENASFIRYSQEGFSSKSEQLDSLMLDTLAVLKDRSFEIDKIIATWNFGGIYFSLRQTLYIDSILNTIEKYGLKNLKSTALSLSCSLVNTIGKQFAQPLTPWDKSGAPKKSLFKKATSDRCLDAKDIYLNILNKYLAQPSSKYNVESWRMDFRDAIKALPETVTTIYADPPYTRDHYSRFYHVLETLSIGDIPNISTVKLKGTTDISKGLYRDDRHQSDFCIKSKAPNAFDDLFRLAAEKKVTVLLSYSPFESEEHPRVMNVNRIIEIASNYYDEVEKTTISNFKHNKLNSKKNLLDRNLPGEILLLFKKPKFSEAQESCKAEYEEP